MSRPSCDNQFREAEWERNHRLRTMRRTANLAVGSTVRDVAGLRGEVVEVVAMRVKVRWPEHTAWIDRGRLTVV